MRLNGMRLNILEGKLEYYNNRNVQRIKIILPPPFKNCPYCSEFINLIDDGFIRRLGSDY